MNTDDLKRQIDLLDAQLPRDKAFMIIQRTRDGGNVYANRLGYARFALEILRAAYFKDLAGTPGLPVLNVEAKEFLDPASDRPNFALNLTDKMPTDFQPGPPTAKQGTCVGRVLHGVLVIGVALLAAIGAATVWSWVL